MYTTIKKFCEDDSSDNGLLLIDSPTGSGKTHSVLNFIFDASMDEQYKNRKIFFVTTQKKNLPIEDLKERFKKKGVEEQFYEKVLFIDSNIDAIINGYDDEIERQVPDEIKKLDEFSRFSDAVKMLKKYKNYQGFSDLKSVVAPLTDELRSKSEPNFRKAVERMLSHEAKNIKEKLNLIHTSKRWQWIGKLYPGVFLSERQIIFLSMDKFLLRNATPLEPSYLFYNSRYMDKAIVFIDEFDATKDTILKNIINSSLQGKVDYIYLFTNIYNALMTKQFPASMTKASEQRNKGEYRNQSLESVIEGVRQLAKKIHDEYSLELSHRTVLEDNESMNKNFLFQDHQYHSVLDADKSFVSVERNLAENKPADDGVNMGLYTYPTLMAADILAMDTDIVPVGKDQIQHVEIARDIAGAVNAYYDKELLKLPEYVTADNVAVLPGTDGRKMSKSYNNVIPIFEDEKVIKKAVYSAVTDSKPIEEPKNPDDVIVYQIYKCFAPAEKVAEMAQGLREGKLGYGHTKAMLLDAILNETREVKEVYDYYMAHYDEACGFLEDGAAKARPYAQKTLQRLKETLFG